MNHNSGINPINTPQYFYYLYCQQNQGRNPINSFGYLHPQMAQNYPLLYNTSNNNISSSYSYPNSILNQFYQQPSINQQINIGNTFTYNLSNQHELLQQNTIPNMVQNSMTYITNENTKEQTKELNDPHQSSFKDFHTENVFNNTFSQPTLINDLPTLQKLSAFQKTQENYEESLQNFNNEKGFIQDKEGKFSL